MCLGEYFRLRNPVDALQSNIPLDLFSRHFFICSFEYRALRGQEQARYQINYFTLKFLKRRNERKPISVRNVFCWENETTRNLIWSSWKTKWDANKMFYLLILSSQFFKIARKRKKRRKVIFYAWILCWIGKSWEQFNLTLPSAWNSFWLQHKTFASLIHQ